MEKEKYQELINKNKPKEPKLKNAIVAFLVGGFLGFFSEIVSKIIQCLMHVSDEVSYSIVCILMILFASLFTSLGFFDDLVSKAKCGLIIPTTGFAHSVTASAIEYKKDGMITGLGANVFRLAGSVIFYGIIAAFFLCLVKAVYLCLV